MEIEKNEARDKITGILQTLVQELVSQPEEAKVTATPAEQTTVFEINVTKRDRGKVIGKEGAMAKSLRHIVSSLSAKHGFKAILEICD